jgi:hypothetical protein
MATSGAVPTSSPTTKWNAANSNPRADVDVAKEAIHAATGMDPNVAIIPRAVMVVLRTHPTIVGQFVYTAGNGGVISDEQVALALGVDKIIIAGTQTNTANEGAAAVISQLWGYSVILAVVNPTNDIKAINFGRTFNWTSPEGSSSSGVGIYQYKEDPRDSIVVRARQYTDEKLTGATAGYHLSSVLQ